MLNTSELIKSIRELQHDSNPLHFEDAINTFLDTSTVKTESDEDKLNALDTILTLLKNDKWIQKEKALRIVNKHIKADIYDDEDYELSFG